MKCGDVIINKYSTQMVYGRILYNNIKEYTPKWFPTIPYTQTVKPTFGNSTLTQEDNLKSYPSGMLILPSNVDGDSSVKCLTTVGPIKSLSLVYVLLCGLLFTIQSSTSINPITNTEVTKQQ